MPIILEVLAALGICVIGADGYEADDVIGTLATGAPMPVDIVTGDRDLFQLVDDDAGVRVLYIARGVGRHERVTNGVVREKYGVDASQYADFATLRGDASDGLPGVAGVGDKTAASLLAKFGDIDGRAGGRGRRRVRARPRPARQDQGGPRLPRPWHPRSSPWPATSTSARTTPPSRAPRPTTPRWSS